MQTKSRKLLMAALPHVGCILLLFVLSAVLFAPQYNGKQLFQSDISQGQAMEGENLEYKEITGEKYYWNNSMFGGMPWHLLVYGRDANVVRHIVPLTRLWQKRAVGMFLGMGILTYLGLVLMKVKPYMACIAAIVMMLNVNHLVLLEAGHNNKIRAIANFPLIFAGMLIALRRTKFIPQLCGAALLGIGVSLSLRANHPQMLYYFLLACGLWFVASAVTGMKGLSAKSGRGVALLIVGLLLGISSNLTQVVSSVKSSESTMRGAPILQDPIGPASSSSVKGLDWDYAAQWSNGWRDLYSLFIPRAVGGSSGEEVAADSPVGTLYKRNGARPDKDGTIKAPMYWGKLQFTSGPYYLGAVIFFLFILSFFVLPVPWRFGFGISTLVMILMSLGNNFDGFNRLLFDHLPYLNRFRTPASTLHATALLFAIPAVLAASKFIDMPWKAKKDASLLKMSLYPAVAISAGACLLLALLAPSLFDFAAAGDARFPDDVLDIFKKQRLSMLRADAFRSIGFIVAAALVLWLFAERHIKKSWIALTVLLALSTIDLWVVAKRYIDNDNWTERKSLKETFAERPVDKQIKKLEGGKRYAYRVLDLSINTFGDASTSFHHNTIGGYNAAKPQRIQDMIDYYIMKGDRNVLNMMNVKYFISPQGQLQVNDGALGNAWFVKDIKKVVTPDEEIAAIADISTQSTAVINSTEFEEQIQGLQPSSGVGTISITSYEPNDIVYSATTPVDQLAVFSEVWTKEGWTVEMDGKEVPLLRANYILRALRIPAGTHEIRFSYAPTTKYAGVTLISSILLLLLFFGSAALWGKDKYERWSQEALKPVPVAKPTPVKARKTSPSNKSKKYSKNVKNKKK